MKEKIDSHLLLIAKKAVGQAAAQLIQNGMLVGLGTGSTTAFFIEALAKRCQEGLNISAIATSEKSHHQAQQLNIPLADSCYLTSLDMTVDGADEIDSHKNMIKGGGGALLREKLIAQSSQEMVVIVDKTKCVTHLGNHVVPIEIIPFFYQSTLQRMQARGYQGKIRLNQEKKFFITDNGNYIFDIQYSTPILYPQKEQERLKSIVGVVETGLFFNVAKRVLIGYEDGEVKILA